MADDLGFSHMGGYTVTDGYPYPYLLRDRYHAQVVAFASGHVRFPDTFGVDIADFG